MRIHDPVDGYGHAVCFGKREEGKEMAAGQPGFSLTGAGSKSEAQARVGVHDIKVRWRVGFFFVA
jgi:hypothetical protein